VSVMNLSTVLGLILVLPSSLGQTALIREAVGINLTRFEEDNGEFLVPLVVRDEEHPLVTVLDTAPHSMSLLIRPFNYHTNTMVRLLYERVSMQKKPIMQHLSDPVIVYVALIRRSQKYELAGLPMGKYIVCGEAMQEGEVYQTSCFETIIQRLDTNTLQSGVKILIILSMVLVAAVIVYAIIYRIFKMRTIKKNKELLQLVVTRT